MPEPNGEKLTALVGLPTIGIGGMFIHLQYLPWWAGLTVSLIGLYLTLPNRMRVVGTELMNVFDRFRSGPAPYKPILEDHINPPEGPEPLEPPKE